MNSSIGVNYVSLAECRPSVGEALGTPGPGQCRYHQVDVLSRKTEGEALREAHTRMTALFPPMTFMLEAHFELLPCLMHFKKQSVLEITKYHKAPCFQE